MIKIVADTLSCIDPAQAKQLGIGYIPQNIIFGDESYRDDSEISSEEFLHRLKSSRELPKTAAPQPILYEPIFQEARKNGDTIILISPTNELSGTFRSASVAAADFSDVDIRIIDSRSLGAGLGQMVLSAVQWVNDGLDADSIVAKLNHMIQRERVYFMVDTLEYLHRGGRITGASALIGGIMQIKPILMLKDGIIQAFEKQRTKLRAMNRLKQLVETECPKDNATAHLTVMHGGVLDEANLLAQELTQLTGIQSIPIYQVPPAILVHAGPGVLAVGFFVL